MGKVSRSKFTRMRMPAGGEENQKEQVWGRWREREREKRQKRGGKERKRKEKLEDGGKKKAT